MKHCLLRFLRVFYGSLPWLAILPFDGMDFESCGVFLVFEMHMAVSLKMHLQLDVIVIPVRRWNFSRMLVEQSVILIDFW